MSARSTYRRLYRCGATTVAALSLAVVASVAAEETDQIVPLDLLVISATRTLQETPHLSASVSALKLDDLDDVQVVDLRTALDTTPGLSTASSGGTGAQTSVFMRGASSHQVLFFVDGVRMNDRSTAYFNFLGGADLAGLDRLEVLRGPQSTLYGSSAMGGVILLETTHGRGETAGTLSAYAGSFSTLGGSASAHGTHGALEFAGSLSHMQTENDEPQNDFDQWSASARLEGRVAETLRLGATIRAQYGDYQEPGSRYFPFQGTVESDNVLTTAFAEWSAPDVAVVSRLTYGHHARDYSFTDSFGVSDSHNRRDIVDWQSVWKASPEVELVGGVNAEWASYTISGSRTEDRVMAGYLSTTAHATEQLTFNAGVRYDDYRSAGSATTGRAGAAWLLNENRTKLRATIGTGFTAPGSDDRYGVPQWGQIANPDLRPEESTGWDVGLDQSFADDRVTASATFFQNHFRDLFDYDFDPVTFAGQVVNRARAETRGVELGAEARPTESVSLRASYTWLEAFDRDTDERLIRRPKHTIDLDGNLRATQSLLIGVGAHFVIDRLDSTPTGNAPIEDYTTVRVYASYAVRADLTLRLRVENALDEEYDEVAGYAALPRAVFGSIDWTF